MFKYPTNGTKYSDLLQAFGGYIKIAPTTARKPLLKGTADIYIDTHFLQVLTTKNDGEGLDRRRACSPLWTT